MLFRKKTAQKPDETKPEPVPASSETPDEPVTPTIEILWQRTPERRRARIEPFQARTYDDTAPL